jgi:hypothetical protein
MPDITAPSLLMFMVSFWNYVALNDTSDTRFSISRRLTGARASGFMQRCRQGICSSEICTTFQEEIDTYLRYML